MTDKTLLAIGVLCALMPFQAGAQSTTDMAVLKGLAPVTMLSNTPEGTAALAANYTVTGGIQTGAIRQSTLLPFAEQQQQALRDAFITAGDLAQLADGLGTTLGASYLAHAHYLDRTNFTNISQPVADVIAYANATTGINSNAGKYFFANATTDGKTPVSAEAMAILKKLTVTPMSLVRAMAFRQGLPELTPSAIRARFKLNRAFHRSLDPIISTCPPITGYTTAGL
jgi:hypothetical protein